jgi:hypothetical protein
VTDEVLRQARGTTAPFYTVDFDFALTPG